jgi:hypothetical protein
MDNTPTTTSPALIVVICVVAVVCLAFWLTAIMVASRGPRTPRRDSAALPGSVLGGTHLAAGGRSVAPNRDAAAVSVGPPVPAQLAPDAREATRAAPPSIPGQRQGASPEPEAASPHAAAPAVPAPRGGDADRPAPAGRSAARTKE